MPPGSVTNLVPLPKVPAPAAGPGDAAPRAHPPNRRALPYLSMQSRRATRRRPARNGAVVWCCLIVMFGRRLWFHRGAETKSPAWPGLGYYCLAPGADTRPRRPPWPSHFSAAPYACQTCQISVPGIPHERRPFGRGGGSAPLRVDLQYSHPCLLLTYRGPPGDVPGILSISSSQFGLGRRTHMALLVCNFDKR